MAVLAIFTGNGITKEMYETLRTEVQWESNHPDGAIFHACAFDEGGHLHVTDVWESLEAMDAFVNERLLPAMQRLDVPPPVVEVYNAYNVNVYPGAQPFFLPQP